MTAAALYASVALAGYEQEQQEQWVRAHHNRSRAWSELIQLRSALNRHLPAVVGEMPAVAIEHTCAIRWEGTEVT